MHMKSMSQMSCNCMSNNQMYQNMTSCKNENNNDNIIDTTTCPYAQNVAGAEYNPCDCGFEESNMFPSNVMYAQSYVPWQTINKTFVPSVGLKMGTIFPELVSPYKPGQSQEEINYIAKNNEIGMGCNKC